MSGTQENVTVDAAAAFEPPSSAGPADTLPNLYQELMGVYPDIAAVERIFLDHLRGNFLADVLLRMIEAVAADPDQPLPGNAGQLNFSMINCPELNYTVRLVPPFRPKGHPVRCLGVRQILGVKGRGTAFFRVLRPNDAAAAVAPGVRFKVAEEIEVGPGSTISTRSDMEILDLWQADGPLVIEALSVQRRRNRLYWHLSDDLEVNYAECGSISASRLQNVFDLARAMNRKVPSIVYDRVLSGVDVQEKLCAIRSLLGDERERGFGELQRALDGEDPEMSAAAQGLLAALMDVA